MERASSLGHKNKVTAASLLNSWLMVLYTSTEFPLPCWQVVFSLTFCLHWFACLYWRVKVSLASCQCSTLYTVAVRCRRRMSQFEIGGDCVLLDLATVHCLIWGGGAGIFDSHQGSRWFQPLTQASRQRNYPSSHCPHLSYEASLEKSM